MISGFDDDDGIGVMLEVDPNVDDLSEVPGYVLGQSDGFETELVVLHVDLTDLSNHKDELFAECGALAKRMRFPEHNQVLEAVYIALPLVSDLFATTLHLLQCIK
jgi:hypothetical protein